MHAGAGGACARAQFELCAMRCSTKAIIPYSVCIKLGVLVCKCVCVHTWECLWIVCVCRRLRVHVCACTPFCCQMKLPKQSP